MEHDRRLLLVRHAQAAGGSGLPDRDRPLTQTGERHAKEVGRLLQTSRLTADAALCSPAVRARQTCDLALANVASPPAVLQDERVYQADAAGLLALVRETADDVGTLLLVGHNPAGHQLTADLTGADDVRDAFPAGSLAVITVSASWAVLAPDCAALSAFVPPRQST